TVRVVRFGPRTTEKRFRTGRRRGGGGGRRPGRRARHPTRRRGRPRGRWRPAPAGRPARPAALARPVLPAGDRHLHAAEPAAHRAVQLLPGGAEPGRRVLYLERLLGAPLRRLWPG